MFHLLFFDGILFCFIFLFYFRFWGTCAGHVGLLLRCIHNQVVFCLYSPFDYIQHFSPCYFSPPPIVAPLVPPQLPPVCDAPLPESTCSHCSTPAYEQEHVVFGFLFLCQFAENDGFWIHPSPHKGHELIVFYGCVVFHGVYLPHFLCPVYC